MEEDDTSGDGQLRLSPTDGAALLAMLGQSENFGGLLENFGDMRAQMRLLQALLMRVQQSSSVSKGASESSISQLEEVRETERDSAFPCTSAAIPPKAHVFACGAAAGPPSTHSPCSKCRLCSDTMALITSHLMVLQTVADAEFVQSHGGVDECICPLCMDPIAEGQRVFELDCGHTFHRCVVQESNSGHQLLLPPAKCCPIFTSRTTQVAGAAGRRGAAVHHQRTRQGVPQG